jgi:hypothetical protein
MIYDILAVSLIVPISINLHRNSRNYIVRPNISTLECDLGSSSSRNLYSVSLTGVLIIRVWQRRREICYILRPQVSKKSICASVALSYHRLLVFQLGCVSLASLLNGYDETTRGRGWRGAEETLTSVSCHIRVCSIRLFRSSFREVEF